MEFFVIESLGNIEEAERKLKEREKYLVFIGAEEKEEDIEKLIEIANDRGVSIVGGIFPGIIYGSEYSWKGAVFISLNNGANLYFLKRFEDINDMEVKRKGKGGTLITLINGFSRGISNFLEKLYYIFGNKFTYMGGGAGDLGNRERECLITNEGIFKEGAIIVELERRFYVNIRHGWEKLYGPFLVTDTEGNRIKKINWEPAFEFYKRVLKEEEGVDISENDFFEVAKAYPIGMLKEREEEIVRDPVSVDKEGALICVGEVPSNSVIYIMRGRKEKLISAAEKVMKGGKSGLVFDCISRALFLQDSLKEEVKAVSKKVKKLAGCFTIGEIASLRGFQPEFFNKTIIGASEI